MALLSAVSCKQTSSDVRANLLLPAPRLMGSHRLKSSITSVLISFLSWTLLISSADIRINEWLMPNFQPLAIFREFQPEGWVEFFHELICKEMESRRPELVRRVEWAQEVMLAEAELPFEPEFIDDLAAKGLHTLFDVVTRRHEQLVVELGLEETAARRLLDVCYARSDAWEKRERRHYLRSLIVTVNIFNAGGVPHQHFFFSSNEEGI